MANEEDKKLIDEMRDILLSFISVDTSDPPDGYLRCDYYGGLYHYCAYCGSVWAVDEAEWHFTRCPVSRTKHLLIGEQPYDLP